VETPSPSGIRPRLGDSLELEQQQESVERMAIYAAQIEGMDRGIGQILDTLEATKQLDNTLILFLADNGGTAEGRNFGFERTPGATLGTAASFASYGQGWATLSNTPFREYKHWVHEGISSPLIAHWPRGIIERGRVRTAPTHLIDIMPTCVELGRAKHPNKRPEHTVPPMEGQSMVTLFKGMSADREDLCWEHEGPRAIRRQQWKLVSKFEQP
jgi:arylsulfatase A-like enzyme